MLVRCKKNFNVEKNQYEPIDLSLEIDKEYIVLEIDFVPGRSMQLRVFDPNNAHLPGLRDANEFEIVSNQIPLSWIIKSFGKMICLGPKSWEEMKGFWEDFFDYELEAEKLYRREVIQMLKEENMLNANYQDDEDEVFKNYKKPHMFTVHVKK